MAHKMKIAFGAASAVALTAALGAGLNSLGLIGDVEIDPRDAHCEIKADAKYPVRIVNSEGLVLHEGGPKRFEMDAEKGTCLYRHNSGDGFIYKMKP